MKKFPPAVIDYFEKHLTTDLSKLAFKASPFPDYSSRELITQLQGLQVAKKKYHFLLEHPQIKYPPKVSLEQSSSEACAQFKSSLISGRSMADLTGGFGLDTFWLGKKLLPTQKEAKISIHYVEPAEHLQLLAKRNFPILGLTDVQYHHQTAEEFLDGFTGSVDWLYLDPSRRKATQRRIDLTGYAPNVVELQERLLEVGGKIMIKLSPMQDISDVLRQLKHVAYIYLCEWDRELKELLIILDPEQKVTQIEIVNIGVETKSYTKEIESRNCALESAPISEYIFEPGPGLQKSSLVNAFGQSYQLKKVQHNSQLLSSEKLFLHPLGKSFRVLTNTVLKAEQIMPYLPKKMANVIVRNFPLKPEAIKKKLGIKEGGDLFLIATTDLNNQPRILVCERITE